LLNPHKGKFNVTAKGGLVEKNYFDWDISLPYLIIVGVNLIGFLFGIWRIICGPTDEIATTLLNLFWTIYNLLLLGAAISVASETKQVRSTQRVSLRIPAVLHLAGGRLVQCHTDDFSEGGVALSMETATELVLDETVSVSLWRGEEEHVFPARVVGNSGTRVRVRWELATREQQMALVQCTFVRADAWMNWSTERDHDQPLLGLRQVLATGLEGYRRVIQYGWPVSKPFLGRSVDAMRWLKSLLPQQPRPQQPRQPKWVDGSNQASPSAQQNYKMHLAGKT
jgi:cellulose synthase (UDP-forming)